jgi:type IV pilus assembly protein PilQ
MACRRSAIAITTLMMAAVFGCASSTGGRGAQPTDGAPAPAASSPAAASHGGSTVQGAAFNEDSDGARLVLSSDAPLLYTAYEPRPDTLVVDLPGSTLSDHFVAPSASGDLVTSVRVEPMTEMGKRLTRLTISHKEGARYDVHTVGQGLAVTFDSTSTLASAEAPATPPAAAPAVSAAPAQPAPVVANAAAPASTPARVEIAHTLEEVRVASAHGELTVSLLGDGALQARDFTLENPPRIVVDLPGVKNEVRKRVIPASGGQVSRIRISQFQTTPQLVTRVVIDLARPTPHAVQADGERVAIVVGRAGEPSAAAQPESARTTIASEPAHPVEARPEPAAPAPPVAEASASAAPPSLAAEAGAPPTTTKAAEMKPPAETSAAVKPATEVNPPPAPPPAAVAADAHSAPADASAAPPAASPAPPSADALRSARKPASPTPAKTNSRKSERDEALFEAAAAVLAQEEAAHPAQEQNSKFQPRTIAEGQSQFTGEPISLHLKDADIKDVFRTISELTQLNIVVDPEVRGTVTVDLEDVPWDQALDLILKQNGLGYVLENNIMRIATTGKLQAEQADRARLAEARQAAEPTRTVIKKLSYARATEITASIKSVMSRRGDIVVDARTNTLIIREIPTYLPAVLQLIENLDTATPQVMIEARIVETTKSLGRSLGINWGVNGVADVAHGNTTGLTFPSTIDFRSPPSNGFRVALDAGPPVIGATFGNILNTFSLDVAITAAENQGLLKIISSPKVAALTNTSASIQSGVQIPVQTNVNNTTTVIYVDATLRLQVTPQITNEGTILLTVNVQKREPAVALNLALGNNVPLTVRQYTGEILVRDGGTAVIGGIFQINDQDQNNMIPGVWKIPILGALFRNKTRTEKHDELLIFITPRIIRS